MKHFLNLVLISALFQTSAWAKPSTHLFLLGGGIKSPVALQKWINAAPVSDSHFLLIHWGTDYPTETCQDFIDSIQKIAEVKVICAPDREKIARQKELFLNELKQARGVFFAGGDQNKIMKVFEDHPDLKAAIHFVFKRGIPVAGTSAGTAIQSQTMISGETPTVQTRAGLGLLQNVILDQHFIRRNREARLKEALFKNSESLGLGIDEDAALEISDQRYARPIFGPTVFMHETDQGIALQTIVTGDEIDLYNLN